jgi:hypothetical protein
MPGSLRFVRSKPRCFVPTIPASLRVAPVVAWLASQTGGAGLRAVQDQVALPASFSKMAFIATRFCTGQPANSGRQASNQSFF